MESLIYMCWGQRTSRKTLKSKFYRTIITLVVIYGYEVWQMNQNDNTELQIFERKLLRICGGNESEGLLEKKTKWRFEGAVWVAINDKCTENTEDTITRTHCWNEKWKVCEAGVDERNIRKTEKVSTNYIVAGPTEIKNRRLQKINGREAVIKV